MINLFNFLIFIGFIIHINLYLPRKPPKEGDLCANEKSNCVLKKCSPLDEEDCIGYNEEIVSNGEEEDELEDYQASCIKKDIFQNTDCQCCLFILEDEDEKPLCGAFTEKYSKWLAKKSSLKVKSRRCAGTYYNKNFILILIKNILKVLKLFII